MSLVRTLKRALQAETAYKNVLGVPNAACYPMVMQISEIIARVRLALKNGETPYSLAKKAGLHRNTLYGCEADDWNPTSQTLSKLEPHLPRKSKQDAAA